MIELYAHEQLDTESPLSIFLAGPTPRHPEHYDWRPEAVAHLRSKNFPGAVFLPIPRDGKWLVEYGAQVDWELEHLNAAKVIVFWIPRDFVELPAFTTNVEFGMFVRSGKIILGYPPNAVKMEYLDYVARKNGVSVFSTLEDTLDAAIEFLKK